MQFKKNIFAVNMPLINVQNRCREDLRNFFSVTKTYWKDQLFPVTFVLCNFSERIQSM